MSSVGKRDKLEINYGAASWEQKRETGNVGFWGEKDVFTVLKPHSSSYLSIELSL